MYITADDVANLRGAFTIPAHYTDNSNYYLNIAIANACRRIDAHTHNKFERVGRTLLLHGDGTVTMSLTPTTLWPLYSVTSIYEFSDAEDTVGELIAATDYMIAKSKRAIINVAGCLWRNSLYPAYKVVATFGYGTVPPDVKTAAVMLVQEEVVPGTVQRLEAMKSESFPDGYSYTRQTVATTPQKATSTGLVAVDSLLERYCVHVPLMFKV